MIKYVTKPIRSQVVYDSYYSDGETEGREVIDSGDWSEDQPTGILTPSGDMIYAQARSIGYLADN